VTALLPANRNTHWGVCFVHITVLGPLKLTEDSLDFTPTARKLRQVLSLLVVNESNFVSASSLIYELWPERPPKSALTTLQTYILHLRKMFATALGVPQQEVSREVLRTRGNGYLLQLDGDYLDLREYRRLQGEAEDAFANSDDQRAIRIWRWTESLWQGSALIDVDHGPLLAAEVAVLEQARMTMLERRIDAELRLGQHQGLLSELAGLTARHPFHEGLQTHYMIALYRSGRRTQALDAYQHLRRSMVDELGLEPSPKLQKLLQDMMVCDPALDVQVGA
jgi:DNA-binding SARP family transcriptional activator